MHRRSVQLVLALIITWLFASCGGNSADGAPMIFAAASVSDVLTESAEIYERETGKQVEFSFGGSIALANQIAKLGAPADGVFLVGEKPKEILKDIANPVPPGSIGMTNSLVVVAAKSAQHITTLEELAESDQRLVIADPDLAPAGQFAREALESAGVWERLADNLIFTSDVRAALAAVESGNATYGIVYRTDAFGSSAVSIISEIYDGYPPIVYVGRSLSGAENSAETISFFEFLARSAEVKKVFESAGFTVGYAD